MKTSLVLGLGFGDEGKGLTTSYLSSLDPKHSLTVRFNGGHQAGHTVVFEGKRHIFSSFGSGTLQCVPTLISRYCTVYPVALMNEYNALKDMGIDPAIYIDPLAMVTTPLDVIHNQKTAARGETVGVGVGATVERHEKHYRLYFQDLYNDTVFHAKMRNIRDYYYKGLDESARGIFELAVSDMRKIKNIFMFNNRAMLDANYDHIILEGAQGILLDQDFGFFPHVTRSYTTSRNALEWIKEQDLPNPDIYYVTRSYQTRHGSGFMSPGRLSLDLKNNEQESNVNHTWAGPFRTGFLDGDLLWYALGCDGYFHQGLKRNLVITCLDQTGDRFLMSVDGIVDRTNPFDLSSYLGIHDTFISMSPDGTKIQRL